VAVAPTHPVRRAASLTVRFQDQGLTIGLANVAAPDDKVISDVCFHALLLAHRRHDAFGRAREHGPRDLYLARLALVVGDGKYFLREIIRPIRVRLS
jgi:hypothetical protein